MTNDDKRMYVADMYPSPGWKAKVANMSDAQVFAIWARAHEKPQDPPNPKDNEDDIPF